MERLLFTVNGDGAGDNASEQPEKRSLEDNLRRRLGDSPEVVEAALDTLEWVARIYPAAYDQVRDLSTSDRIDDFPGTSLLRRAIGAGLLPDEAWTQVIRDTGIYLLEPVKLIRPPLPAPFDRVGSLLDRSGGALMASPTLRTYTLVYRDPFLARSGLKAVRMTLESCGERQRIGQGILSDGG